MEFMVEMLVTAFALGGILGAVVALHLSADLRQTDKGRAPVSLELSREEEEEAVLKTVVVDDSRQPRSRHRSQ